MEKVYVSGNISIYEDEPGTAKHLDIWADSDSNGFLNGVYIYWHSAWVHINDMHHLDNGNVVVYFDPENETISPDVEETIYLKRLGL